MELKDMILSTLAELEDDKEIVKEPKKKKSKLKEEAKEKVIEEEISEKDEILEEIAAPLESVPEPEDIIEEEFIPKSEPQALMPASTQEDERAFCESIRERILVLFEGFQSPNNKSIEAKVDLTLNFLEYLLAVIDERLETLNKKEK